MRVSTEQTSFGTGGAGPATTEMLLLLPLTLTEPTGPVCAIVVDLAAPEDTGSWYDIWQAAVAVEWDVREGWEGGEGEVPGGE